MINRVLGGLAIVVLAGVCAVVEVFYLPLRVGSVLVPASVLAAIAGNIAFTRLTYAVTGSVAAALMPAAVWLAVIGRAAVARPEGDLLITDGGSSTGIAVVNLAFLILGALALAYAIVTLRRHSGRHEPTQVSPATTQGNHATLDPHQTPVTQPPNPGNRARRDSGSRGGDETRAGRTA